MLKTIIAWVLVGFFSLGGYFFPLNQGVGAPTAGNIFRTILPESSSTDMVGTSTRPWAAGYFNELTVPTLGSSGNPCTTVNASGTFGTSTCGGGGSVSTSSDITAGYFPYWASSTGQLSGTSSIFFTASNTIGLVGINMGEIAPSSSFMVNGTTTFASGSMTLRTGQLSVPGGSAASPGLLLGQAIGTASQEGFFNSSNGTSLAVQGVGVTQWNGGGGLLFQQLIGWKLAFGTVAGSPTTYLLQYATATLQLGDSSSSAPVSQTLTVQGSRGGTDSNVSGGNFTLRSGRGTGTSTPSSIFFEVPTVTSTSATTTQPTTTMMTINATGTTIAGVLEVPTVVSTTLASATGLTFTNGTSSGNLQVATLKATGAVNASSTVNISGTLNAQGALVATGNATLTTASLSGNLNASSTSFFTGLATFVNALFNGTTTFNATSTFAANIVLPADSSPVATGTLVVHPASGTLTFGTGANARVIQPEQCINYTLSNLTSAESKNKIYSFYNTSTITKIFVNNKSPLDNFVGNFYASGSLQAATSTSPLVFATTTTFNASTSQALSCYASATTTACSGGTFGSGASTTMNAGWELMMFANSASTTQTAIQVCWQENP